MASEDLTAAERERRRKISESKMGRKRPKFEEMTPQQQVAELARREKIAEAKRGKKRPDLGERNRSRESRERPRVLSDEGRKRLSILKTTHGHGRKRGQGRGGTPTYYIWAAMHQRCTNPRNKEWSNYGGRGVTVCDRWKLFENFLADMGEKPDGLTIDRIDNDGNYEPGNCHWATWLHQASNTRKFYATLEDVRWVRGNPHLSAQQCAEILGCSSSTVWKIRARRDRFADIE